MDIKKTWDPHNWYLHGYRDIYRTDIYQANRIRRAITCTLPIRWHPYPYEWSHYLWTWN